MFLPTRSWNCYFYEPDALGSTSYTVLRLLHCLCSILSNYLIYSPLILQATELPVLWYATTAFCMTRRQLPFRPSISTDQPLRRPVLNTCHPTAEPTVYGAHLLLRRDAAPRSVQVLFADFSSGKTSEQKTVRAIEYFSGG